MDMSVLRSKWCRWLPTSELAKKASSLAGSTPEETISAIYAYVAGSIAYDYEKADALRGKRGYVPDPERTYETKSGVCSDMASLMCAMLSSVGVPCKICVGYLDGREHAWVLAKSGDKWLKCDPTLASGMSRWPTKGHVYEVLYEI